MAKKTNFEMNGKKYFRVTRTVGFKADGTRIRKTFYGECEREAIEKADEYINKLKYGLVNDFENITINDLMHAWLFDYLHNSSKIKPSTFQRYEGIYRNYVRDSSIAGNKVHSFNLMQLQNYYNDLYKKDYSYSQLKTLNSTLKTFFNWCIINGYILKNPCLNVNIKGNKSDIIKNKRRKVEILSEEEISIIKKYLLDTNNIQFYLLFLFDIATGFRMGELLAIDWKFVDLDKKEATVDRSVKEVYVYDDDTHKHIETVFQVPKTQNSYRTVPLPSNLVNELAKTKNKNGLLFHDENNNPLKGKNVSTEWTKILKACGLPHRKFHAIRHTYGSMLLKNGIDIQTVAELMGHTAISITQIYMHSSKSQKDIAIDKLNSLF